MLRPGIDAYELPPNAGILFGWTDEESRAELVAYLKKHWPGPPRFRQSPDSIGACHLYGALLHGWGDKPHPTPGETILVEMHVVACANLADPPSGDWQRKVPYEDETESSIRLADLIRKPAL